MAYHFSALAQTNSGVVQYSITVATVTARTPLEFVDTHKFAELCANGCPNYCKKWSCPPYSPSYVEWAKRWKHLVVFLFQIELSQFSYIKNDYLKVKAANIILKSRADRFIRHMAKLHGAYISTGSCRLCKSCHCKIGEPCQHPDLMSFSYEAMGVDVGALTMHCFNKELLWYKPRHLPQYTSVVLGLLTDNIIVLDYFKEQFINIIKD